MINNYQKTKLMHNVVVYKNLLNNNKDLIDLFETSKTFHNCSNWCDHNNLSEQIIKASYLHSFRELKRNNTVNGFSVEFNHKKFSEWEDKSNRIIDNSNNDFLKKEKEKLESKLLLSIIDLKYKILNDYLDTNDDKNIWPTKIETIKEMAKPNNPNDYSQLSFFKYDYVESEWPLLDFHTDATTTGPEHIISIMFYLNDEYENGEIEFVTPENNIISYKPKSGDIIVFPSFFPYFHSARYPVNGSRYTIRTSLDLQPGTCTLKNIKFEDYASNELLENISNRKNIIYIDGREYNGI